MHKTSLVRMFPYVCCVRCHCLRFILSVVSTSNYKLQMRRQLFTTEWRSAIARNSNSDSCSKHKAPLREEKVEPDVPRHKIYVRVVGAGHVYTYKKAYVIDNACRGGKRWLLLHEAEHHCFKCSFTSLLIHKLRPTNTFFALPARAAVCVMI